MRFDYWGECIKEAFEDAGITATKEQIDTVVSWVEGAYENKSPVTGQECIPNPLKEEIAALKKELSKEKTKGTCRKCDGTGRLIYPGPYHTGETNCYVCRGEGWIYP